MSRLLLRLLLCSLSLLSHAFVAATATFTVHLGATTPWHHHWEESVGSGHAALTSRSDWRAHLSRCRKELGVKRTRFHGLLDDDFSISLQEGSADYINLDSLVDFHLSIGMEPLFEVSFMPSWLATNTSETVCHYKGISSPPSNYTKWGNMIHDMAAHLHQRYPNKTFMFEVWNEPNGGFWSPGNRTDATKLHAYLELYRATASNLKSGSGGQFLVGGPATAGCPSEWLAALVDLDRDRQQQQHDHYHQPQPQPQPHQHRRRREALGGGLVDFLSCHAYGGGGDEATAGDLAGLDMTTLLHYASPEGGGGKTRPSVLTEWSSSWSFDNKYHDDVASAAFIVAAVDKMSHVSITSYWTFSDVFEGT